MPHVRHLVSHCKNNDAISTGIFAGSFAKKRGFSQTHADYIGAKPFGFRSAYFGKYALTLLMLVVLVLPTGCGNRNAAMQKPVASSGASSEEIWYQYGGARLAYTAVARPKQLHTGYGAVRDPALFGQAPPITTQTPPKRRPKAKSASAAPKPKAAATTAPPRDPNCPPCPPADANAPQSTVSQIRTASSTPPPATPAASGAAALGAPPPSPARMPLPGMPSATPASPAPDAPTR